MNAQERQEMLYGDPLPPLEEGKSAGGRGGNPAPLAGGEENPPQKRLQFLKTPPTTQPEKKPRGRPRTTGVERFRLAETGRPLPQDASEEVVQKQVINVADRMWRLKNMYLILDEEGQTIPFKMRHEQLEFITNRHTRNFVPKARKLGMSTMIVIDYLDRCLFKENHYCGVIDLKETDAAAKLAIAKFAWLKGPQHPNPAIAAIWQKIHQLNPLVSDSSTVLKWTNGSIYTAGVRYTGKTPQALHISEYGPIAANFPAVAEDIKVGSMNSVPKSGIIDVETTMQGGRIGECYSLFQLALKGAKEESLSPIQWKIHFFSWLGHPSYSLKKASPKKESTINYFRKLARTQQEEISKHGFDHGEVPLSRQAWWEQKEEELGDKIWQQFPSHVGECDMSAISGQILPQITAARLQGRVTSYNPEVFLPYVISTDLGSHKNTAMWLLQPAGRHLNVVDCAFGEGAGAGWVAEQMRKWEKEFGTVTQLLLPHDANITDKGSGVTYVENLVRAKVDRRVITVVPRTPRVWAGIELLQDLIPKCYFHSRCDDKVVDPDTETKQPSGVERLENYRSKPDSSNGTISNVPVGDICSHAADGLRCYAEAEDQHLVRSNFEVVEDRQGLLRFRPGKEGSRVKVVMMQ